MGMKNRTTSTLLFIILFAASFCCLLPARAERSDRMSDDLVYIGTYTTGKSQGIYVYRLSADGKLAPLGLAVKSNNPSFLAIRPGHPDLYAVNEIDEYEGKKSAAASAFSIDRASGRLSLLNIIATEGSGSTHLAIDKTGRYLLTANYSAGSISLLPILEGGRLGKPAAVLHHTGRSVDPERQTQPYAHSVYFSPDNRYALSADLGTDKVYVYRFDAARGTLAPNDPPYATVTAGSGPRHFAFSPDGKFGYLIEEMASSITAFRWDSVRGVLHPVQSISTLPKGFKGQSTSAEIFVHPNGRFVYGSNRGHDSIAVFAIDPVKGTLTPIEYVSTEGKNPRGFGIDPTGHYLIAANQDSDTLVVFRIDPTTGRLTPTGQKENVGNPVDVVFEK